jgi:hypothetical protein
VGFGRVDARTLRPRPPLLLKDAAGRCQPVGRFVVVGGAVWATQAYKEEWVWRVPLAGGPAHAVVRVSGFAYGLAADESAAWMLSGTSDPSTSPIGPAGCGAWTSAPVRSPRPRRCRTWPQAWRLGLSWAAARSGWPARTRGCCTVAASCCGSIPPPAG